MKKLISRFVGALALAIVSFALPVRADENLAFGAGKVSSFEFSGQNAVVVGVNGLTEDYFYDEDYYGATCFIDERITDAEKEDGTADDNWWCGQISELNMMYMSGWAKTAGLTSKYATVDDALDYFRANPKLIRYATTPGDVTTVVEGTYGYDTKTGKNKFVNWFKAETKTDLSKQMKTGTVGTKFGQTLQTLLGKGEYLMQIAPEFFYPEGNPRWSDMAVTHALVCCGYILDPEVAVTKSEALTGLFIIDSDNDQNNNGGGWNAPNSIIYCPVEWDSESNAYIIYNLWGDSPAYLYAGMSYEALKNNKPATVTITFDGNGAEDYEKEVREYEVGDVYGEFPEVYRDEEKYTFLGWYTAKTKGTKLTEESVVLTKSGTVYAQWEEIKPHTLKIVNGWTYDEDGNQVTSLSVYPGVSIEIEFDESKTADPKTEQTLGAFQYWTVSTTATDLGEDFEVHSQRTSIVMPNAAVALTANYVPVVAANVTFQAEEIGDGNPAMFCWAVDSATSGTLCDGETAVPLAAGKYTIRFSAIDVETGKISSSWRAPADRTLTVTALGKYTDDEGTYYDDPAEILETVRFVAADGSKAVAFDANGGSVSPSSMYFIDGGEYYELPVPTRSGYVFNGWYTAKTALCCGLGRVTEGSAVDFSVLDSNKPTLYAQWLKSYDLTLKGTDVTAVYEGAVYTKSVSVQEGDAVTLTAPGSYEDANGNYYLFQCWTPSKAYDFGDGYFASSCETTIEMPAAKLTMTATYVKESETAWMTMYATGATVEAGDVTIEADTSKFYWSVDGKAWFQNGTQALVKKGTYTVQWKSTSDVWTAPTTKTKVTVAAGQEYDNGEDPAVFTFATTISATPVVYADGEWYESDEGGTVTMKPTDGRIPTGKTITLTAKAAKGYAFAGWQYEKYWDEYGLNPSASATTYTLGENYFLYMYIDETDFKVHINAVFRPITDYVQEDMAALCPTVYVGSSSVAPSYDDDDYNGSVEVRLGLNCASYVYPSYSAKASPLTFKLAGSLPKGLKFDATYGYISGTPTVAGTYPLTVTATDPAGHKATLAISLVVRSVFEPIVGDWRALLTDESGAYAGLLEMSITDKGKASAKVITASGTASVTPSVVWTEDEDDPEADGTFSISWGKYSGNDKSGSYAYFSADPSAGTVSYETSTWKNYETTASAALSGNLVRANSSWFNDKDFAATFLGKYYTVQLSAGEGEGGEGYRTPSELMASGYLTLTTDKKGGVKVAGKLPDGEKISASAVLLPSESGDSASALVFVVPSGYKKKGSVALQLEFDNDGVVLSSVGAWVTPPLLDAISGWESDEEIFLPGLLSLFASGAVYSKLDDLTNYYLTLAVSMGESTPTLEYSYTDSEKTKYYERAEAVTDVEYYLSSDSEPAMLTGGKGGKITVGKSASPWKDSEGYYHYDETKEDKDGNTQPIMNPGGLTISYKSATGIFSGKFNLFFDYEVPQYKKGEEIDSKKEHKSVSCSYEGVLINNGSTYGVGSAVYSGKYTYEYEIYNERTGTSKAATKTYTQKFALPVEWSLEAGDSD